MVGTRVSLVTVDTPGPGTDELREGRSHVNEAAVGNGGEGGKSDAAVAPDSRVLDNEVGRGLGGRRSKAGDEGEPAHHDRLSFPDRLRLVKLLPGS